MKLDIVIPVLNRDLDTFMFGYKYIKENLPCKRIVLIGDRKVEGRIKHLTDISFIDENTIVDGLNLSELKVIKESISGTKRRTGWYFQQFLKIGYAKICKDEYYLIWDADTIPIKKIIVFDNEGHPLLGYRQFVPTDSCFDETQDRILPNKVLHKTEHRSYIAEHLLVNVSIMNDLISKIEANDEVYGLQFFEKIMYCIPKKVINLSGFSEFELYAAFVIKYYPQLYVQRKWKNLREAKTYIGSAPDCYDIKWISSYFDTISIEDFNSYWLICRLLKCLDPKRKIGFGRVYQALNPVVSLVGQIRFKIRNIIKK